MAHVVSGAAFDARGDLGDWRYLLRTIEATFRAGSFRSAAELAVLIAGAADDAAHHPDIDIRYPDRVHVVLSTHELGGEVTELDLELAATISLIAAEIGARSEPTVAQVVEIALDALDIDGVRPFWRALLGYTDDTAPTDTAADDVATDDTAVDDTAVDGRVVDDLVIEAIRDPARIGPPMWFQQMEEPRAERNRFHVDVTVPHDAADARIADALAAGGRLVTDEYAPSWWVLADPEGNEACVCTWQNRD